MFKDLVHRLQCPACGRAALRAHAFRESQTRILDGALGCAACGAAYAIEAGMLSLVQPALIEPESAGRFAARFARELTDAGLRLPQATESHTVGAQLAQRRHFDWFAENAEQSYTAYQSSPFWVAEDALTFERWRARLETGAWLLDVGCANGRSVWPLLSSDLRIVGCDISPRLVRQAIARAEAGGVSDRTCFIVADCDRLPFVDDSFQYVLTYGVLHHLPDPARACRDIQRVLARGGIHFGSENNRTVFRTLFDALMRWRPLWVEKAGAEPLISEAMLREWMHGLPVRLRCVTSVFVPPHLVNAAGHGMARGLLSLSDRAARLVPLLRGQGGLIVFDAQKTAV